MHHPLDTIPTSGNFQDLEKGFALWDQLEATAYERIITSQHDFVQFLHNLHLPDDVVHYAPEGGWPEITKESFAAMEKSDKAIEVLRNMAYIEGPWGGYPREILNETHLADYRDPSVVAEIAAGKAKIRFFTEPPYDPAPRDVVGLTEGGSFCRIILLDCRYGIVRWLNCDEGRTAFGPMTKGDPAGDGNPEWGGDTAWPVEEFFEYMKAKFTSMEQLSGTQSRLIKKDDDCLGVYDVFKEMYQRHGWPGTDYNKEECMKEMTEYCEKHGIH